MPTGSQSEVDQILEHPPMHRRLWSFFQIQQPATGSDGSMQCIHGRKAPSDLQPLFSKSLKSHMPELEFTQFSQNRQLKQSFPFDMLTADPIAFPYLR